MNFKCILIVLIGILIIDVIPSVAIQPAQIIADEYEPDNSPEIATTIAFGETQSHSIHEPGDLDWLRFSVPDQMTIRITINDTIEFLRLELFEQISENYFRSYEGIEIDAQLELLQGTYTFVILSPNNNVIVEHYSVSLDIAYFDDLEPNDSFETAQEIVMNSSLRLSLELRPIGENDIDWLKFNNTQTQFIDFQLIRFDYCMFGFELYDNSSQLLAISNPIYHRLLRQEVHKIVMQLDESMYFIQISTTDCYNDRDMDYDFQMYSISYNETEPNNDLEHANFIQNSTSIDGILEFNDISNEFEEDYYNFSIDEARTIEVQLKFTVGQNFYFDLMQDDGEVIGHSNWITQPSGMEIVILTYRADIGTFYLRVHANRYWNYEQALIYNIRITDPEPDAFEPNDRSETAIDIGELTWYSSSANFHNSTDIDWFSFSTEYSRIFRFNYGLRDQDLSINVILYSLVGDELVMVQFSDENFQVEIPNGDYRFRISSSQGLVGWYDFWIDPWPYPDDRESEGNDYVENAVLLTTNSYYWGNLHVSSDIDWWYFDLVRRYEVLVDTNGWSGSPQLTIYDSNLDEIAREYRNDNNPNDPFPIIQLILDPGTYYLSMTQDPLDQLVDWYEIRIEMLQRVPLESSTEPSTATTSSQIIIGDNFLVMKVVIVIIPWVWIKRKFRY